MWLRSKYQLKSTHVVFVPLGGLKSEQILLSDTPLDGIKLGNRPFLKGNPQ
jgi:hypothetical protein